MTRIGAPAKPWYDLVVETLALKGMTKAELSDRSEVAKSTIDKWATNPRKPQAAKVNAVADVLGIPRARAVRLAGIITDTEAADRSPPDALDERFGREDAATLRRVIRETAPEQAEAIIAAAERRLRRRASGAG